MSQQTPLEIALAHSMTHEEYDNTVKILGREPNYTEIGIISAMWSEHCSYKSSTKYLKGFPTKAPWVIQGPGENAGVIDIGDGYAAVFKMESHNHPSFIEPYQGAATGVGGIMRDVFTMGARPIASMNLIQFANIDGDSQTAKKHRHLLRGVVAGIGGYGNCMGVPTIGGQTNFEECYAGNNLVNAFNLGLAKSDEIFLGVAEGIGNPVMYVGSKTGRDGLGGAVMSSAAFTEDNESKRPTVQVGDPFTEKLLLEACLELFKEDLIIGIQDMGAAGLTSSSFEMAGRSGSGMKMDLDKVPAREEGMTPYDFMLSESQERMLICAKKGCEQAVIDIFEKWELSVAVIGEVTDTGNMELFWHGEKCADIPIQPLSEEAPVLDRPVAKPAYLETIEDITLDKQFADQTIFDKMWSSIEIVDKSWIYDQYDSMVQTNTIKGPGKLDGSVIRIKENGKALAMSADCNTRLCYINPELGAAAAVMEAGRNVAMTGARPLAATDCLNFGNPEDPEVMWQFMKACDGIKAACKELNTPIIGGNVSLYNETNGVGVFPTPAMATVGVNDDMNNVLPSHFQAEGNYICILGDTYSEFGGSLLMKELYGKVAGTHPEVDFDKELKLWDTVIDANKANLLESAKDVNVGGIAIAAAKMSVIGNIGCDIRIALEDDQDIFSESLSRAIVEIKPENIEAFDKLASSMGITYVSAGKTGGDIVSVNNLYKKLDGISDIYFNKFQEVIEQDL
ncbi:MAG: phosphoribosylformylglycinamidine synthase subunit PurL [Campylobacteraceae bacterium]|nr:phosphoribosylformylglycinamidine synthase subunit PurL [Campylobacteraceae bacterium]MBT3882742.1 phosphoribosylformylglycinamidine synthase subunit PurL [Campylobacteraceae bacterium]MBT4179590.1 phosphoribosylformylglycinamidine synthase subunit PurL [Campylobacteraceae bacterium]MBT4571843.1 phosphoribosylformylglycinamidine synthase subunit PurL [Campylobacteraceae bacterium]MBT6107504.1 phosphoribosylformylglycinamidine synthase subunit PurL [Campylobacteraceae bacterium]